MTSEFLRSLNSIREVDDVASGDNLLKAPSVNLIGADLAGPTAEMFFYVFSVAEGGKKAKAAEKELLTRVRDGGDINILLDVVNASLSSMVMSRYPNAIKDDLGRTLHPDLRTPAVFRNIRAFVSNMFKTLSQDAAIFDIDHDQISTRQKMSLAQDIMQAVRTNFSEADFRSLPQGFHELYSTLPDFIRAKGNYHYDRFAFSPELSRGEVQTLHELGRDRDRNTLEEDFNVVVKAWGNYHRGSRMASLDGINVLFETGIESDIAVGLIFLNASLHSPDRAISNRALLVLTEAGVGNITQGTEQFFLAWPKAVQPFVEKMIDGEPVNDEIRQAFEDIVQAVDERGRLKEMAPLIFIDYPSAEERIAQGNTAIDLKYGLLDKLNSREYPDRALELLARVMRERHNQISKKALLELFDERRPLGFFMQNLKANWEDLQGITREQIWPGFINAKRVALWPSERELDVLQFTGRHPASVLGLFGMRFFTRGFTPPEVGLEFTFKTSDSVLAGRLQEGGKLVNLPFELEETHPFVYAFLEHIAVGSFEELVTIASKRIGIAKEGRRRPENVSDSPVQTKEYAPSLPRAETSYIRLTGHVSEELTSDEIVAQARSRERLPRAISQRVVPLKYAVRYRFFSQQARAARERGADLDEIRSLEGLVIQNLALIPNPSIAKLDNLPSEFALEAIELSEGGTKYLDTWRVEHVRPKPKAGEEQNLPAVFERRYKAAPIALTEHLETWFTQPPLRGILVQE